MKNTEKEHPTMYIQSAPGKSKAGISEEKALK
jgi:hypothetical protein